MNELVLVSGPGERDEGARILAAAECLGVRTRNLSVGDMPVLDQLARGLGGGGSSSAAISVDTLSFLCDLLAPESLQSLIESKCAKLIVFGTVHSRRHADAVRRLAGGAISGFTAAEDRQVFRFPERGRAFSRAFAGQSFSMRQPAAISAFELIGAEMPGVERIMLADERPTLLRLERGACEIFLLALGRLPAVDTPLSPANGIEDYYDQIIPILIVLRHCFEGTCWRGTGRGARLIIDDPLLRPSYGFLDFRALRHSMQSAGYGTSMAFIPWNHWRTSKAKASEVFGGSPNLTICVHGCDHSNREFDEVDPGALQWMADTALRRMERHESRTGLAFEPVMVFPQGRFSTTAMLALRRAGYLAAINTSCFPTNAGAEPLCVADLLRPAITKFHGFPLFQRRYPRRLIDFAFDIFVGRPVLIVQHHQDFQHGHGELEAFVDGLRKMEPRLRWGTLSGELTRSCMVRKSSEGTKEVRFFTRRFRLEESCLEHSPSGRAELVLSKEEPDPSAISTVVVDGKNVPFTCENNLLTFEHQTVAGRAVDIEVVDRPMPAHATFSRLSVSRTVSVPVRRALSEFRDGTLARYPRLLAAATGLAKRMGATGRDYGSE